MPHRPRLARILAIAALAAITALPALPAETRALEPPRPLPGYRAGFVTQLGARTVNDCLWASASMLLDKWTNGRRSVTHERLRRLSGDARGGSNFHDLARAFGQLGIELRFSPDGGERVGWATLLKRLRRGAGAVILGDYGDLPYHWGRWDHAFWKATGKKDNHAVYIERYDPKHDRVWWMDPLAPDGWKGEWIPVRVLRKFAWSSGGALYVATSPTAKAAPFAGVSLGGPAAAQTDARFEVSWPVHAPRRWTFDGADVGASFERVDDPLRSAATAPMPASIAGATAKAPARPSSSVSKGRLRAAAALPARPGAYLATIRVTDRRFGREVAAAAPATVFVPGARRAYLGLRAGDRTVVAGTTLDVRVDVANTGPASWAAPADTGSVGDRLPGGHARTTWLSARWIWLGDGRADRASERPIALDPLPLEPGGRSSVEAQLLVPAAPGRWALTIDVVDDVDGSFAAGGSAPAVAWIEVVEAIEGGALR